MLRNVYAINVWKLMRIFVLITGQSYNENWITFVAIFQFFFQIFYSNISQKWFNLSFLKIASLNFKQIISIKMEYSFLYIRNYNDHTKVLYFSTIWTLLIFFYHKYLYSFWEIVFYYKRYHVSALLYAIPW